MDGHVEADFPAAHRSEADSCVNGKGDGGRKRCGLRPVSLSAVRVQSSLRCAFKGTRAAKR
jgi:hypothetical protein